MERLAAPGSLCQNGTYGDVEGDGPVCIRGALLAVGVRMHDAEMYAVNDVYEATPDNPVVIQFNDDPNTSMEDALLLLKQASAHFEEAS
jgi:hypothetical protein